MNTHVPLIAHNSLCMSHFGSGDRRGGGFLVERLCINDALSAGSSTESIKDSCEDLSFNRPKMTRFTSCCFSSPSRNRRRFLKQPEGSGAVASQSSQHRCEGDQRQQNHLQRPGGVLQGRHRTCGCKISPTARTVVTKSSVFTSFPGIHQNISGGGAAASKIYVAGMFNRGLCGFFLASLFFKVAVNVNSLRKILFLPHHQLVLPLRPQQRRIIWQQLQLRRICTTRKWRR